MNYRFGFFNVGWQVSGEHLPRTMLTLTTDSRDRLVIKANLTARRCIALALAGRFCGWRGGWKFAPLDWYQLFSSIFEGVDEARMQAGDPLEPISGLGHRMDIGALTDAPAFYDEESDKLWAYEPYAVRDPLQVLADTGRVVFGWTE